MQCCNKNKKAIILVRGNDTDFNNASFLTIRFITEILDLSTFKAVFKLGNIVKTFDDLSSGEIVINFTAAETARLLSECYGTLNLIDTSNRIATIENRIPFEVISVVDGNAIATEPYTLNFDVKQGGETILNISVESAVTVEVGTTTTLPAGSDATVTNSGIGNHLILNFGIPKGEDGLMPEWGNIGGNILDQQDLQDELQSISGGLADSIQAVDDKYDSITGALDDKIDSINGALSDSITALDSVVSSNFTTLSDSITNNYNTLDSLIGGVDDKIDVHIADVNNPHSVTKSQVGLGNVDNTSDADKPVSTAQQTALDNKVTKNAAITAATKCKITYDTKGLVTAGADLEASDIPVLNLTKISDVTASASEVNILDGATLSTTELNYVDGVTSAIQTQFDNITDVIPAAASDTNQLADKNFVNSSIATNTANFIGTFNSVADLEAYSGTLTNNDYAFVIVTDGQGNTAYDRYKYTTATTPASWVFEYELNNSSFTADQWAAINSLITADTKVTHTANTAVGNSTTPVYIDASGNATALSCTLATSVPVGAVFTDTTYTFSTGSTNGTIAVSVNGGAANDVSVKGLGTAAYTLSSDYATSIQGGLADSAIQSVKVNGTALTPDANKAVDVTVPTNYVTTDTAQDVSGRKTFLGEKAIYFKQNATTDKLGFTLYNPSNSELAALEWRPSTINGNALLALNCPQAGSNYVGFRYWANINIVAPRPAVNGTYFIPVNITNGNTTVTASNTGTVDISSLMPSLSGYQTTANLVTSVSSSSTDSQYPSAKLFYDTCGDIETLINAL